MCAQWTLSVYGPFIIHTHTVILLLLLVSCNLNLGNVKYTESSAKYSAVSFQVAVLLCCAFLWDIVGECNAINWDSVI